MYPFLASRPIFLLVSLQAYHLNWLLAFPHPSPQGTRLMYPVSPIQSPILDSQQQCPVSPYQSPTLTSRLTYPVSPIQSPTQDCRQKYPVFLIQDCRLTYPVSPFQYPTQDSQQKCPVSPIRDFRLKYPVSLILASRPNSLLFSLQAFQHNFLLAYLCLSPPISQREYLVYSFQARRLKYPVESRLEH